MKWLHPVWLLFIFCLYDEGNTTVDELMMRLMGAMEIFTAQQQEDIKDEVRLTTPDTHLTEINKHHILC